jgi:hypothetical protein
MISDARPNPLINQRSRLENTVNIQQTNGRSVTEALPERLLKRNLAEQAKWINDTTGDRSWAKHPTQQMPWMMSVQVKGLTGVDGERA